MNELEAKEKIFHVSPERFSTQRGAGFLSAAYLTCGCEGVKGVDVSTPGKYYNQSQFNTQGEREGGASAEFPQFFCIQKPSDFLVGLFVDVRAGCHHGDD